jgi:hypothetical protein
MGKMHEVSLDISEQQLDDKLDGANLASHHITVSRPTQLSIS